LGVHDAAERKDDIGGREFATVVETGTGTEPEFPGDGVYWSPSLKERGLDLAVWGAVEQGFKNQPEEALGLGAIDSERVEELRWRRGVRHDKLWSGWRWLRRGYPPREE
jgi:hypothetical protein